MNFLIQLFFYYFIAFGLIGPMQSEKMLLLQLITKSSHVVFVYVKYLYKYQIPHFL